MVLALSQVPEVTPENLNALSQLFKTLVDLFGPWGTAGLLFAGPLLAFAWRAFNQWVKEREVHQAIAARDKEIARLAEIEKEYRIGILIRDGWTNEQISRFIVDKDFKRALEPRQDPGGGKGGSGRQIPRRSKK